MHQFEIHPAEAEAGKGFRGGLAGRSFRPTEGVEDIDHHLIDGGRVGRDPLTGGITRRKRAGTLPAGDDPGRSEDRRGDVVGMLTPEGGN